MGVLFHGGGACFEPQMQELSKVAQVQQMQRHLAARMVVDRAMQWSNCSSAPHTSMGAFFRDWNILVETHARAVLPPSEEASLDVNVGPASLSVSGPGACKGEVCDSVRYVLDDSGPRRGADCAVKTARRREARRWYSDGGVEIGARSWTGRNLGR